VFNEKDEEACLRKFVSHIQELRPHVIVTYNGDKFDWPYVETRCRKYSYLNLYTSLGIRSSVGPGTNFGGEYPRCGSAFVGSFCKICP
jgi:DNA polymerase elongation subunit (family B)